MYKFFASGSVAAAFLMIVAGNSLAQTSGSGGEGVAVGTSSLIGQIQYSDTFDISSGQRNGQAYSPQAFPLTNQQYEVQSDYNAGVPASSNNQFGQGGTPFSIANDANFTDNPSFNLYPGGSGAGSANGFTQSGVGGTANGSFVEIDFGINYAQGTNFVVQFDAVQSLDRIDLNIGSQSGLGSADGLSIFFRGQNNSNSIGLFNNTLTTPEHDASFLDNVTTGKWNNYAAAFNLTAKTVTLYTNGTLLGTIDLTTFDGGAYANVLDANSANVISIGEAEPDPGAGNLALLWTDNFQVGLAAAPEPSTYAMLIGGVALLLGIQRFRKLRS